MVPEFKDHILNCCSVHGCYYKDPKCIVTEKIVGQKLDNCDKCKSDTILPVGIKFDEDKPRWDLLPMEEVEDVVKVLTNGSKKYKDNNWMIVEDSRRRYYAAAMRHIKDWWVGKIFDTGKGGDGLHHLSHAICCLLFLMWFDNQGKLNETKDQGSKLSEKND